jgi:perosamine synthetase
MILRDHGRLPGDTLFQNIEIGYKYKMSNIQAALGLAQLERIDELVNKKIDIFKWYKDAFKDLEFITLNPDHPDVENSYWMTTAVFDKSIKMTKFEIINFFKNYNISTRPFFEPLSSLKAYMGYNGSEHARQHNENAYGISSRGVNLSSASRLTHIDIKKIKELLIKKG